MRICLHNKKTRELDAIEISLSVIHSLISQFLVSLYIYSKFVGLFFGRNYYMHDPCKIAMWFYSFDQSYYSFTCDQVFSNFLPKGKWNLFMCVSLEIDGNHVTFFYSFENKVEEVRCTIKEGISETF